MRSYLFATIILCAISALGQSTFEKTFGKGTIHGGYHASSAQQTTDGGYIITGSSGGGQGSSVCLVKTKNTGDTMWTKFYGEGPQAAGRVVQQTPDGGYILVGWISNGAEMIYVIRTDSNGDTLWTKKYAGWGTNSESLYQTTDGGFIIAAIWQTSPNNSDAYLLKINSLGNIQWAKTYGGSAKDFAYSVIQTADNGYIFMGYTESFVTVGIKNIYLVKTDSNGNPIWTKFLGGNNEICNSFKQTSDGCYIFSGGSYDSLTTIRKTFLLKTDSLGNPLWQKRYHVPGSLNNESGQSVEETNDGGFIIAGESYNSNNSYGFLIKTNTLGNILWSKKYVGHMQYFNEVHQTLDDGYILTGIIDTPNNYAFYLVKTDDLGNSCSGLSFAMNTDTIITLSGNTSTQISSVGTSYSTNTATYAVNIRFSDFCMNTYIYETEEHLKFSLYPNPSTGILKLNQNDCYNATVSVTDVLGNKVCTVEFDGKINSQIDLTGQAKGIYFVEIVSEDKRSVNKIILE